VAIDPASDSRFTQPVRSGPTRRRHAVPGSDTASPFRMLAANADRERAIDVLKAGFAEGRLTQAEYNDRMTYVYVARTYDELSMLVGDLPAGPAGRPGREQSTWFPPQSGVNSMAVAAFACGIGGFFTVGLTAIPAIALGRISRRHVRRTGQPGESLAQAGVVLGWVALGLVVVVITALLVALSISGHNGAHPLVSRPVPGGPAQGG